MFPISLWNLKEFIGVGLVRTKNAVKDWYCGIQYLLQFAHPTLWIFLDSLQKDNHKELSYVSSNHKKICTCSAKVLSRSQGTIRKSHWQAYQSSCNHISFAWLIFLVELLCWTLIFISYKYEIILSILWF